MHKWSLPDRTVKILCTSCSKKEYKGLEIRESWKTKDMDKEFTCEKCGVTQVISRGSEF